MTTQKPNEQLQVNKPDYRKIITVFIGILLVTGFLYIAAFGGPYSS